MPSARHSLALALAALLTLAACQSSEERAEGHYQDALALLAEDDTDRALVELRNVFDLDGQHREARRLYAATLAERGALTEAYGQYLRLAEQFPDDLDARLALGRIAVGRRQWDEVRRHGAVARELAPDDAEVRVFDLNIAYADALAADDAPARREAVRETLAAIEGRPDDLSLRRIAVDGAIRDGELDTALARVEETLAVAPEERSLYDMRVNLLSELDRGDEVEPLLLDMIDRFPGEPELVGALLRFYVTRGEVDAGEAFLRARAETAQEEEATGARIDLARFLLELKGPEAALAELPAEEGGDPVLRALRAQILFNEGSTDEAIAEMESLLEGAEGGIESDENRVVLARMLEATGNRVGAQRLVAQVLEGDSTQIEALKMEAGWRIAADDPDGAIALLRTALDESPDDARALTLMAQAHSRNGNRDLARDMLSLAVDASGNGVEESRRYVALLLEEDRVRPAEEVLLDALRATPGDSSLMLDLANVYIRTEDWGRVRQVESQLRRLDTPEAARLADGIEATRLASEGRMEDAISFLEELAAENSQDMAARIAVVRARMIAGDAEGALSYAEELRAEAPDDLSLALIQAAALASVGRHDEAAAIYREVLGQIPGIESAWVQLVRSLIADGDSEGARTALAEGLEALPDGSNLLWAQASFLEGEGDRDGALEIYARLYAQAPDSLVIANNYASLLSTLRGDDPEAIERAYAVARRLRGSEQPAFQDTYGWLSHLRGDQAAAVEHLEPAAAALSGDALVQYHLGAAYRAQGRDAEAEAQFRTALTLMETDGHPQIETVRAALAEIEGAGGTTSSAAETPPAAAPTPPDAAAGASDDG